MGSRKHATDLSAGGSPTATQLSDRENSDPTWSNSDTDVLGRFDGTLTPLQKVATPSDTAREGTSVTTPRTRVGKTTSRGGLLGIVSAASHYKPVTVTVTPDVTDDPKFEAEREDRAISCRSRKNPRVPPTTETGRVTILDPGFII